MRLTSKQVHLSIPRIFLKQILLKCCSVNINTAESVGSRTKVLTDCSGVYSNFGWY